MPELDAIRGLAILAVVVYHAFYWARDLSLFPKWQRLFLLSLSPGQFGVNLFFVLSGFLITGILVDSRQRADYYLRFYLRRALRILPAYYFTIFLLILFGLTSGAFLIMSLAYCANLSGLFGIMLSYPVLWSLAVEEHFYLLWPTAVKKLGSVGLLTLLAGLLLLSPLSRLLYHLHAAKTGIASTFIFYTWNNADGLALGAAIALLVRRPGWAHRQLRILMVTLILAAVVIAALGYPEILTRRTAVGEALQFVPWNLGSGALLALFLLLGTSRWKRLATPAFLIFFGNISYGLYLYHVMFLQAYDWLTLHAHVQLLRGLDLWTLIWIRAILAGSAAVAFSHLSRRYLEGPFLRLKSTLREARPQQQSARTTPEVASTTSADEVLLRQAEDTPASKALR
jgi:peptidoglycan/LPS O-acetylase OafA/YrhL